MKKQTNKPTPPKGGKAGGTKKPLYRVPFYVGIRREEKKEDEK